MHITKTGICAMATVAAMTTGVLCSANAQTTLLGGYTGDNETALQSPAASNKVSVTLTRTGSSTDITQGNFQSAKTTWGNATLDTPPPTATTLSIVQSATVTPFTLVLTVTNTGPDRVVLNQIHYWVKKDVNNEGPPSGTLTYLSGDLDDTDGTSTAFSILNGVVGYDITLNGFLTDTELLPGESAIFEWAHDAPQNPAGNTGIRVDNFAVSGQVIPIDPPGTLIYGR